MLGLASRGPPQLALNRQTPEQQWPYQVDEAIIQNHEAII